MLVGPFDMRCSSCFSTDEVVLCVPSSGTHVQYWGPRNRRVEEQGFDDGAEVKDHQDHQNELPSPDSQDADKVRENTWHNFI